MKKLLNHRTHWIILLAICAMVLVLGVMTAQAKTTKPDIEMAKANDGVWTPIVTDQVNNQLKPAVYRKVSDITYSGTGNVIVENPEFVVCDNNSAKYDYVMAYGESVPVYMTASHEAIFDVYAGHRHEDFKICEGSGADVFNWSTAFAKNLGNMAVILAQ